MNGWNPTILNPNPNAIPNRNPNRESIFLGGSFSDPGKNKEKNDRKEIKNNRRKKKLNRRR